MGIYSGNLLTSVIQNIWSPQTSEQNLLTELQLFLFQI